MQPYYPLLSYQATLPPLYTFSDAVALISAFISGDLTTLYIQLKKGSHFEDKVVLRLQQQVHGRLLDRAFELHVAFAWDVQRREKVADQPHEHGHVVRYDLGHVKVAESPHQHFLFRSAGLPALKHTTHSGISKLSYELRNMTLFTRHSYVLD